MFHDLDFTLRSRLWKYKGAKASWYFISLPEESADKIKFFGIKRRGWGALPVQAKIGLTEWNTSIFPDSKSGTYILPVKSEVRKKEKLQEGDEVDFSLIVNS